MIDHELTDTEKRIFLSAMRREKQVCEGLPFHEGGVDLVSVCSSIIRKVKRELWGNQQPTADNILTYFSMEDNAMAINRKAKAEAEATQYDIQVTRAKELENETIMFDMLVNGIQIYGCSYKTLKRKDNGEEFAKIGFPSRKGSDGKYYNQVYFKINDDLVKVIEKAIEAVL